MVRLRSLIVCAGASLGLAATALAMPPVLEKAPADAAMVFAIPNPDKLHKSMQSLGTAVESPLPLPALADAMAMLGIHGGVATDKSMAFVVMTIPDAAADAAGEEENPPVLMLIPVTSFADFLGNFEAKPGAAGALVEFETQGMPGYARDIGDGYAAMSTEKSLVENFKPGNNNLKADMGPLGEKLADTSDVVVVMNIGAALPAIKAAAARAGEGLGDQMAMMGVDADAAAENPMGKWISQTVMEDAKVLVGGIKAGGLGVSLEMAASFKEGSMMSEVFATRGNANALLNKLPNAPFLLAGAIDTASPGVKKFFKAVTDKARELAPDDAPGGLFAQDPSSTDGQSFAIGMSPTMLMGGGVLTNTVQYTKTANPDGAINSIKSELGELNGKTIEGMTYEFTYKDGGGKVGETTVDTWQLKIQSDGSDPMAMQSMAMIFGPSGGPGGYLSKVDGGLIRTYARNSKLMTDAMAAANGAAGLASDPALSQVAGQMPSGRVAEAYIGFKNILDMVLPMAAMFGVQLDPADLPESLPPIGLSIGGEGGSAHLSVYLPAPVIKTVMTIGEELGPQFMDMGDFGDMEDPGAEEPTGQPRF